MTGSKKSNSEDGSSSSLWSTPFGLNWRKALVSIPRLVPDRVLRYTNPDGPQPVLLQLSSRSPNRKIPLYTFIPLKTTDEPLPVLLDFHGGGFILGSCQEQAPFCAKLARELGCVAMSVDYRLGPYDKFPAANEDAEDVLSAVLDAASPAGAELREKLNAAAGTLDYSTTPPLAPLKLDSSRIAVSGFSSGGNLALNLALSIPSDPPLVPSDWPSRFPQTHSKSIPLLLFYPSLDCRQLPSERPRPAGLAASSGFFASLRVEDELMPTYLPRDKAAHPRASPGLADVKTSLHKRAKMLLVLPELDTLSAQSEIWIKQVQENGRMDDLSVERFQGTRHGWTQFPDWFIDEAGRKSKKSIFDRAVAFTKEAWS